MRVRIVKRAVSDEHQAIMDAVLSRQSARAVELLTQHISKTGQNMALTLGEDPAKSKPR
jgi:DNA-binding GntR family transcriptional regulator